MFRRPIMAAVIAIIADLLLLAAAIVLNALRGNFSESYTYTQDLVTEYYTIYAHHPFDLFGIPAAVVLVIVAGMSAVIIAGAFVKSSDGKSGAPHIVGACVLLAASVAVVFLSMFVVKGAQPQHRSYLYYTDETMHLTFIEEKYSEDYGALKIFRIHEDCDEAELLAMTDISEFAESNERYSLAWIDEDVLQITYADGMNHRSLQLIVE